MIRTAFVLLTELLRLLALVVQSRAQLAAENLFLRKQLACYLERKVRPRRTDIASRIMLVVLSRFVEWRPLLTIVRPDTFVRWHREAFDYSGAGRHADWGSAANTSRTPAAHRQYGRGQPHVG